MRWSGCTRFCSSGRPQAEAAAAAAPPPPPHPHPSRQDHPGGEALLLAHLAGSLLGQQACSRHPLLVLDQVAVVSARPPDGLARVVDDHVDALEARHGHAYSLYSLQSHGMHGGYYPYWWASFICFFAGPLLPLLPLRLVIIIFMRSMSSPLVEAGFCRNLNYR